MSIMKQLNLLSTLNNLNYLSDICVMWDENVKTYILHFWGSDNYCHYEFIAIDVLVKIIDIDKNDLIDICIDSGASFDGNYFSFVKPSINAIREKIEPYIAMKKLCT